MQCDQLRISPSACKLPPPSHWHVDTMESLRLGKKSINLLKWEVTRSYMGNIARRVARTKANRRSPKNFDGCQHFHTDVTSSSKHQKTFSHPLVGWNMILLQRFDIVIRPFATASSDEEKTELETWQDKNHDKNKLRITHFCRYYNHRLPIRVRLLIFVFFSFGWYSPLTTSCYERLSSLVDITALSRCVYVFFVGSYLERVVEHADRSSYSFSRLFCHSPRLSPSPYHPSCMYLFAFYHRRVFG